MKKLEEAVDYFITSMGLTDKIAPKFASCILVYGEYGKRAMKYFSKKKLKMPVQLVTKEDADARRNEYTTPRAYHFNIHKGNLHYYLDDK